MAVEPSGGMCEQIIEIASLVDDLLHYSEFTLRARVGCSAKRLGRVDAPIADYIALTLRVDLGRP